MQSFFLILFMRIQNLINSALNKYFCHVGLISILLIINSTSPLNFQNGIIRWYHVFSLAILIYIINKEKLKWEFLGKFKFIYYLLSIVIFFNSFFNPYGLNVTIGLAVTNLAFLLLIPAMSDVKFKKTF